MTEGWPILRVVRTTSCVAGVVYYVQLSTDLEEYFIISEPFPEQYQAENFARMIRGLNEHLGEYTFHVT